MTLAVEMRTPKQLRTPERDVADETGSARIRQKRNGEETHACCPASHFPEGKGTLRRMAPWQTEASA